MQQLTSMMIYGVFERFPKLRVAFLESGCGWVPYLADRLDESWEHRLKRWPHPTKLCPSEIMRGGNLYYSCEREEKTLWTPFRPGRSRSPRLRSSPALLCVLGLTRHNALL